jgi:hypothetical protein
MENHIVDLFKQDKSVVEIKTAQNRYVLIHNLVLEIYFDIVTDIAILQKATVESTSWYYYDMLKPECTQLGIDFSSLLIEFLNRDIATDDLMEFED